MITLRLSLMMFLQFFIWGGWFVTLGTYLSNTLSANGGQIGMAFSTQSWGAIIAPFIVGLIADRFFNAEKILGLLHIVGAVLMYCMYQANDFASFYPYVLAYMIRLLWLTQCHSDKWSTRQKSSEKFVCGALSAGLWQAL